MKLMGMVMMVELSSADLCKMSVQEVADLLLNDIEVNDKSVSGAVVYGTDDSGRMYSLYLKMELFVDE